MTEQKNMCAQRDTQLDCYRSLAMMYILCVIHTTYWLNNDVPEIIKSAMLFEIPVIFFVSGAALRLSRQKSVWEACVNRFKRVMSPYYIYAGVCLALWVLFWLFDSKYCDRSYTVQKAIVNAITVNDVPQPFIYHLWFVIPYMVIMCLSPLSQKLVAKIGGGKSLILNVLAFALSACCHRFDSELLREVLCYNIFMLMGYCYYKRMNVKNLLVVLFGCVVALCALWLAGFNFVPMQANKFPPNLVFLVYGSMMLCILSLLFGKIRIPQWKIIDLWNKKGYTIYLYQNFAFWAYVLFAKRFLCSVEGSYAYLLASAIGVFLISTLFSYPASWVEGRVVKVVTTILRR